MGIMQVEHLTEDLLERLLKSETPDQYLQDDVFIGTSLSVYLGELLKSKQLKRAQVARESGVNTTFVYDIFKGKSLPGRDTALMIAFGLGCTLRETQRLLRLAGVSELWPKRRRDAIILWCLDRGYSRQRTDEELFALNEPTLLNAEMGGQA